MRKMIQGAKALCWQVEAVVMLMGRYGLDLPAAVREAGRLWRFRARGLAPAEVQAVAYDDGW
jgi:hypothetical protein